MKKFSLNDKKLESPFVSPENYFESLSEKVQKRIQGEQEPAKVSRKLPFGVPENYFELLPQRIMKRISSLTPKVWYKERTTWQWAIATCSVVFLVWAGNSWFVEKNASKDIAISEKLKNIDNEELVNYIAFSLHKEVIFEEIKEIDVSSENDQKNSESIIQDLSNEHLEEQFPEHLLKEILDELEMKDIFQEQINDSI